MKAFAPYFRIFRITFERTALLALGLLSLALGLKHMQLRRSYAEILRTSSTSQEAVELRELAMANAYSSCFEGAHFPNTEFYDLVTGVKQVSEIQSPTLVILFSARDCQPCLNYELTLCQELYREQEPNTSVSILAIASEPMLDEIHVIKKINRISFPIWYDTNEVLTNFVPQQKFPLIMLVERQRVIKAYFPIAGRSKYSLSNMQVFKRFLDLII